MFVARDITARDVKSGVAAPALKLGGATDPTHLTSYNAPSVLSVSQLVSRCCVGEPHPSIPEFDGSIYSAVATPSSVVPEEIRTMAPSSNAFTEGLAFDEPFFQSSGLLGMVSCTSSTLRPERQSPRSHGLVANLRRVSRG